MAQRSDRPKPLELFIRARLEEIKTVCTLSRPLAHRRGWHDGPPGFPDCPHQRSSGHVFRIGHLPQAAACVVGVHDRPTDRVLHLRDGVVGVIGEPEAAAVGARISVRFASASWVRVSVFRTGRSMR